MRWRRFFDLSVIVAVGVATAGVAQERFDYRVRDDMFRAFGGNEAAFRSAMATIGEKLSENPDHAVALVWRGVGSFFKAGRASGADAKTLATNAMADMDRALALEPRNVGVLIPRAAVMLVAARNQRDPTRARDLATRAAGDFEAALAIRQDAFAGLGQHNRGEYLSGLAESWALAGRDDKAEGYLKRILAELPSSPYAERAAAKLADWNDRQPLNCQSCH
jgi:tetratricopeptide (TPR) repeat protein